MCRGFAAFDLSAAETQLPAAAMTLHNLRCVQGPVPSGLPEESLFASELNGSAERMTAIQSLQSSIAAGFSVALLTFPVTGCKSPGLGPGPVLIAVLDPAAIFKEGTDALDRQSRQLAGPGAINCGRVQLRASAEAASKCALKAQDARKPFRVRYDLQGVDSEVAIAIIRTPKGTVGR